MTRGKDGARGARVLVVSGVPAARLLLEKDLRAAGMSCRSVPAPETAARVLDGWRPDVVVLDAPATAKEDWLRRLALEVGAAPVMVVAGPEQAQWAQSELAAGRISALLRRPWRAAELERHIASVLERHRADGGGDIAWQLDGDLAAEPVEAAARPAALLLPFFRELSAMAAVSRGAHGRRVASVLTDFGRHLGIAEKSLELLALAGLVHDMGELDLPESTRRRPEHALDAAELELFRRHPERGAALLERLPGLSRAARYVRSHHERFDGLGFPDGLAGEAIPLAARLLAVVDRFDEAVHGGLFPTPLDEPAALRFLQAESGSRFDPRVVRAFLHWKRSAGPVAPAGGFLNVPLSRLRPGMRLARDLRSAEGVLLVPAGHRISAAVLARLRGLDDRATVMEVQQG